MTKLCPRRLPAARALAVGLAMALAAAAASEADSAPAALRIDGLGPLTGWDGQRAEVQVRGGMLMIAAAEGNPITITPWPAYLPQRLATQQVWAARVLHPGGPADRVELRRLSSAHPWLVVASGVRIAQPVVGNWRLDRAEERWILRNGEAWRMLKPAWPAGRAAEIRVEGARWCVYLLEEHDASRSAADVVQESEAQVTLAAVRRPSAGCSASPG